VIDWQGVDVSDRSRDRDPDELPSLRPPDAGSGTARVLVEIPLLLVAAAVIALVVKTFLAQAFFIPSESMEPQLATGDRVVVSRLSYQLHEPRRGDVLVFDDPTQPPVVDGSLLPVRLGREALEALGVVEPRGRELIKRVVALPGETVWGQAGQVVVDGRPLIEPYLSDPDITDDFAPIRVPDDHVFVMGDSRRNSKDSRRFGPVSNDLVVGRAIARVWPPGRIAHL
jgi:signal peptidase I